MKKGIIATALLALAIGCMTVILSIRLCNWVPSLKAACWVQEQIQDQHEIVLIHHNQVNNWHKRIEVPQGITGEVQAAPECELGKAAAYALGNSGEETALTKLESIALNAHCLEVRKAAVHAIEGFGSDEARAALERILIATAG